jgi:hypothetical protein
MNFLGYVINQGTAILETIESRTTSPRAELAVQAGINIRNDFPPDSTRLSGEINEFAPNHPAVGFRFIKRRTGGGGRKRMFTWLISTKLDEALEIQRVK